MSRKKVAGKKKGQLEKCVFCLNSKDDANDEAKYGRVYEFDAGNGRMEKVHYFCLLFGSGLAQNGPEDEGVAGFLPKDIMKEQNRGGKLACSYCKNKGATIGCYVENCSMKYHFHCGLAKFCQFKFFGKFPSFCPSHKQKQKLKSSASKERVCLMCLETIRLPVDKEKVIICPTDKCNYPAHRECIQRQASSAGLYFKCANCQDKEEYIPTVKRYGVYVPDKDADWEADGRFTDQAEQHHKCEMEKCLCEDEEMRFYHDEGTDWEIIICQYCGGHARHITCANLKYSDTDNGRWSCDDCRPTSNIEPSLRSTENQSNALVVAENESDQSDDDADELVPDIGVNQLIDSKVTSPKLAKHKTGSTSSTSSKENDICNTKLVGTSSNSRNDNKVCYPNKQKRPMSKLFPLKKKLKTAEILSTDSSSSDIEIIGEVKGIEFLATHKPTHVID